MGVKGEELASHNGETDMNVMAQAHKKAREFFATHAGNTELLVNMTYALALKVALKQAHQEYKAMQTKTPAQVQFNMALVAAEKRIAELQAIDTTDGYIVIVGDNIRLPMNEQQGKWCAVENASIFWYREDAQRFAGRIVNGSGEVGRVVKKVDQIAWEIEEQQKLMANINEWLAQAK